MKTPMKRLLCGLLCASLSLPAALAASITSSVTSITLPKGESTASFDLILTVYEAFAGAEFGLKPSADDITLMAAARYRLTRTVSTTSVFSPAATPISRAPTRSHG